MVTGLKIPIVILVVISVGIASTYFVLTLDDKQNEQDDTEIENWSNNTSENNTNDNNGNDTYQIDTSNNNGTQYNETQENNKTESQNETEPTVNLTSRGYFNASYEKIFTSIYNDEIVNGWFFKESPDDWSTIYWGCYISNMEEWNLLFEKAIYANPADNNFTDDFIPDFENYTYSLLYWGWQSSSGYSIEHTNVLYDNGTLKFYHEGTSPSGGVFTVMTCPNSFIQIPKSQFDGYIINSSHYY